jgi:hypothetical protein
MKTYHENRTLAQALSHARNPHTALGRACKYLVGKPEGGWGETVSALADIRACLPYPADREYSDDAFLGALYILVTHGPAARTYEFRAAGETRTERAAAAKASRPNVMTVWDTV